MAQQEKIEVGNSSVVADGAFADGYYNGSLYYYDTNYQLSPPLTSETLCTFITKNLGDQGATALWNVGFVVGWIAALCENNQAFFFASIALPEAAPITEPLPAPPQQEA